MATATKTGVTGIDTPNDTEVVITRVVDAPRRLVFEAYTVPRHIQQWMLGPDGWTMPVCEFEARAGGRWHYVWRKPSGKEMAMSGTVSEFVRPELIAWTEQWGPEWPETMNRLVLSETDGQTLITLTITYPSKQARDAALATGMNDGTNASFARLDELVQTLG
jgi:uncharacterized protein YndB with AHSA1/START domain